MTATNATFSASLCLRLSTVSTMKRNYTCIRSLRIATKSTTESIPCRAFTHFASSSMISRPSQTLAATTWLAQAPTPSYHVQHRSHPRQNIMSSHTQQRQWFGTRRRPPQRGNKNNKNKKAPFELPPGAQFFEIDEDEDDGEQWKKFLGEEGDEWEEVPFDDEGSYEIGGDDDDDYDDDGMPDARDEQDAMAKETIRKFLSSRREAAAAASARVRAKSKAKLLESKTADQPDDEPTRQHSLNPRLSSVISAGWSSLNTTAKYILGKTQSSPLLKGDEQYIKGRPSNEQLTLAYQMHQMIQDYLRDLVDVRYDSTFCIPGTLSSIEIRAVETSPDLHLARVYWSLPSDCLAVLPDSLQVKLIHHMQDVVFNQKQGKRKIQRAVHTQLRYLRNPPKVTMVWWDDEVDEFEYEYNSEEHEDDNGDKEGEEYEVSDDEVGEEPEQSTSPTRSDESKNAKKSAQQT